MFIPKFHIITEYDIFCHHMKVEAFSLLNPYLLLLVLRYTAIDIDKHYLFIKIEIHIVISLL